MSLETWYHKTVRKFLRTDRQAAAAARKGRKGECIMLTAITGVNWGDEGKGRMVDLLSEQYDIVVR